MILMKQEQWVYHPDSGTWKQIDSSEVPCFAAFLETPLGTLSIQSGERFIHRITISLEQTDGERTCTTLLPEPLIVAKQQLKEYFEGNRTHFLLPLFIQGTPFQCKVWRMLAAVPYGTTQSYKVLAQVSGYPHAARAIGTVMHDNPLGIVLPCHRIIGSNGKLIGYRGGLHSKAWLLEHESKHSGVSF